MPLLRSEGLQCGATVHPADPAWTGRADRPLMTIKSEQGDRVDLGRTDLITLRNMIDEALS